MDTTGALTDGPLLFAEAGRRSLSPGDEALVHVRPMLPSAWVDVVPGMRVGPCKHPRRARNGPRELGEGFVVEVVDLPAEFVPNWFGRDKGTSAFAEWFGD